MAVIQSEKHLKQIEKRNQTRKNNILINPNFQSIQALENQNKLPHDRIDDYQTPINLDDGKNKKLFDFKQKINLDFLQIEEWYKRIDVQFEIIKQLYNREFALLVPSWIEDESIRKRSTRMLRCHSVQHFQYFFNKGLRIFERKTPYNLYYSLGSYLGGIPYQTMRLDDKQEYNQAWIKEHCYKMIGYDFLIDIDAGEHEDIDFAHETTLNIAESFNELNVPYEVVFSGMGFHVKIPFQYIPKHSFFPNFKMNQYQFLCSVAKALNKKYSEMIDTGIYDSRRVCKIPYSLSLYEKDIYICSPMKSLNELKNFKLENYHINNYSQPIKNRGTRIFNEDGDFKNLLNELGIK